MRTGLKQFLEKELKPLSELKEKAIEVSGLLSGTVDLFTGCVIKKTEDRYQSVYNQCQKANEAKRQEAALKKVNELAKTIPVIQSSEFQIANNKNQILLEDLRNLNYKNFRSYYDNLDITSDNNNNAINWIRENKNIRSPSRSYIKGKDFMFADPYVNFINSKSEGGSDEEEGTLKPEIQPLILNEFQPNEMISPNDLLGPLMNTIFSSFGKFGKFIVSPVIKTGGKITTNAKIDYYSVASEELYGTGTSNPKYKFRKRQYFTSDPVEMVLNMFGNGGKWLNTYELPYYGNDYLEAKHSSKWKSGDSSTFLGKGLAGGEDSIGVKMFGIDFPANPKFSTTMDSNRKEIVSEFYLINKNDDWLIKNFKFLNAIAAGTNWLHLKYGIIRPPNVYHVLCPGRFQIYWATMDCEITFEGKLRKNWTVSTYLKMFSKAIDENMLWPDAWKVKFTIKDLTPNNFNLYADYYLNGFERDALTRYEKMQSLDNIAESFITYIDNLIYGGSKEELEKFNAYKKAGLIKGTKTEQIKDEVKGLLTGLLSTDKGIPLLKSLKKQGGLTAELIKKLKEAAEKYLSK